MGAQEKENKGVELTGGGGNCGKADGGRNCSSEKSKLSSIFFLVGCISISGLEALGKGGTGSGHGRREHRAPKRRVTIAFRGGRVYVPGQQFKRKWRLEYWPCFLSGIQPYQLLI